MQLHANANWWGRAGAIATILVVDGMGCRTCAARVRAALLESADVLAVEVDLGRGLATVYSRLAIDSHRLAEAAWRAGQASGQRYQLRHFATVRPVTEGWVPSKRSQQERPPSEGATTR